MAPFAKISVKKGLKVAETEEFVRRLAKLKEHVGEVYPVLADEEGNIINGWHRIRVDPNWHRKVVPCKDMAEKALVWLAAHERRAVTPKEVSVNLIHIAEKLLKENVPRDQIVAKISELTNYSESYIRKLLPAKYKALEKARVKAVKTLYPEEKPKPAEEKPPERRVPTKYLCPICGSGLAFIGDLLVPYHEALKR